MFLPIHDGLALSRIPRPYVTWAILAATVVTFIFTAVADEGLEATIGFAVIPATYNTLEVRPPELMFVPEYVTLFTYIFLHGDIWHLIGNMMFLWVFGDNVEDAVGHVRFAVFYALCGAAAALVQIAAGPESPMPMIGASGAVAGVVAAYLMLHPRVKLWILALGRIPIRLNAGWVLSFWIAVQLWSAIANADEEVAFWAHVGGFAAGALLILVFRRRGVVLFDRGLEKARP